MKKSKEVKAKSARIKEHIEGVIESLTKNKEGEPIAGPYYGNRTVKRDNTRDNWRAGFTKTTLASRRKKRRAARKRK